MPFALAHLLVALPQHGEVLKRDGKRVRVDLSHSGGPKSKWTTLDDICKVRAPKEKKVKPKKEEEEEAEEEQEQEEVAQVKWKYKALAAGVIRESAAMDSEKAGKLTEGEVFVVTERQELDDGTVRVKFDRVWPSVAA